MKPRHDEIVSNLPRDLASLPRLDGFRLRGLEMTRLETFIDAAFAFAITTLVIAAQQVPDDMATLLAAFRNVPTFVSSIAVIWIFWRGHWLWSRRYGLEDSASILISWSLLVTVLIYIYPLRAVFGAMWYGLSQGQVGQPLGVGTIEQVRALFAAYALGFSAIAFEMLLLNWRAWHLREALQLDTRERLLTLGQIRGWCVPLAVGLLSLVFALTLPVDDIGWSGWIYFSLAVFTPLYARVRRRNLERALAAG